MLTPARIAAARERIRDVLYYSPCQVSHDLSELAGHPIYLKLENLQRTGAFKERGALNRLLQLTPDERARGVIAASAGNHAQGVAFHAARLGIRARIVMPQPTPLVKVSATRGFGADVILHGANYDEACEEATRLQQEQQMLLLGRRQLRNRPSTANPAYYSRGRRPPACPRTRPRLPASE